MAKYNEQVAIDVANKLSGRNEDGAGALQIQMRNMFVEVIRQYCEQLSKVEDSDGNAR